MGQTYGGEVPIEFKNSVESGSKPDSDEPFEETTTESLKAKNTPKPAKTATEELKNTPSEDETADENALTLTKEPQVLLPEGEADSSATFSARVFTAEGAYPIEGAKVVVYRGDNIYAFIETDSEGRTKAVRLPAFAEENSLEEDNPLKSIDYFADVFAAGFVTQKALLVSAVGGSDITLDVLMVPDKEGLI